MSKGNDLIVISSSDDSDYATELGVNTALILELVKEHGTCAILKCLAVATARVISIDKLATIEKDAAKREARG